MNTEFVDLARGAREASLGVATLTRGAKDAALHSMAEALLAHEPQILSANAQDVESSRTAGVSDALLDRLRLDSARLESMAQGLRALANLIDPVGEVIRGWQLPNGVHIDQVRVPLGVVGIIYEARPNVTADAAGICLKSGNAVLLRGSSSATNSNRAIVAALQEGLSNANIDPRAISLVEGDRSVTDTMMAARGLVDVLIPRGGASLIEAVVRGAQVPVLETGSGNCHLYVDRSANQQMAIDIMLNAKTQRPSVCNALETLVVDAEIAKLFIPDAVDALVKAGVSVHGDSQAQSLDSRITDVTDDDWDNEALSLDLRVAIVDGIDEGIAFIRDHTSGHSETIISDDASHQKRFIAEMDCACVFVNTSSRFADGEQFGFGAEIGISTQKLHARGPMALPEMTTTKYVITGDGQVR
ncbi:MAG: glutamate-5-semialdehyde dehydrogenase [Propionibacteriaceae bacterium]|nr:glutamate-5-semialdehyde dehydrogenase [Propionibacteriaceae bacterium]